MKRRIIGLAAAVAVAGSMAAAPAAAQEDLVIAESMPWFGFPFFVHMDKEIRAEAEAIGGIELIVTDGENDAAKQSEDVLAAVTQQVDGILISPKDSVALAPAIQEAVDAGVPVMTVDRRVEGVEILGHVGADNVIGGEAQGQLIIDTFPDGATIVNLQGTPGSSPAIDRNQGVHNVLDPLSDTYVFVAEQTAEFRREDGANVTESILGGLEAPPDVIVAANDDMALGAMTVVQEQGLDIKVIGFDALPEALAAVQDGGLLGTVEQFPGGQATTALNALVDFVRDGTEPDALTLLEPIAITVDNIDVAERLGELE
jgi:ABC-type sugar transport system substrate-binding protein